MMPRSTGWVNSHPFEPTTRHPTYLCGVGGEMVAATVLAHGSGQSRAEIEKRDSSWLRYGTVHCHEYREAAARRQCRRSNLSPRQSLICTVLYQLGKGGFFFFDGISGEPGGYGGTGTGLPGLRFTCQVSSARLGKLIMIMHASGRQTTDIRQMSEVQFSSP